MSRYFKISVLISLWLSIVLIDQANVLAENKLPEILYGETLVCTLPYDNPGQGCRSQLGSKYFYAGMTGNFAVYNPDESFDYGFLYNPVTGTGLANENCTIETLLIKKVSACFYLGRGRNGEISVDDRLLVGRATVSQDGIDVAAYEAPALYQGGVNVVGDVFSTDLNNFAFWGRNLAQNANDAVDPKTGASWGMGMYSLNPEAQSTWLSEGNETSAYKNYREKIDILLGQAQLISASKLTSSAAWYLQGEDIDDVAQKDASKYPEGKIWLVENEDLNISLSTVRYFGKGTIIVRNGSFVVDENIELVPNNEDGDRLGIISLSN